MVLTSDISAATRFLYPRHDRLVPVMGTSYPAASPVTVMVVFFSTADEQFPRSASRSENIAVCRWSVVAVAHGFVFFPSLARGVVSAFGDGFPRHGIAVYPGMDPL